jgi:hypothetical protein
MNKRISPALLYGIILIVKMGFCSDSTSHVLPVFSGYTSFQAGEVEKGNGIGGNLDHWWLETGYAGLMADAAINDHFRVLAALEGELDFSFGISPGSVDMNRQTELPMTSLNIKHAEGIYSFGDPKDPFLQLEGGLFPYKYNPDARNLGEYLFRSYAYPQYIDNVFDRPYADIAGLRIGNQIGGFHEDLLLTSEIHDYPLMDFSLSYVANYNFAKIVEVGAGINFDRLFPVHGNETTPSNYTSDEYYTSAGDSGYYSFSGTKIMARLSFDPKEFLPSGIFSKEDLKIYSEFAILGLKNYSVDTSRSAPYYTNISQRMPIMLGFNFPVFGTALKNVIGFKALDLLSIELEYWQNPYPNSFRMPYENFIPLPTPDASGIHHDNLKWSFYAKRDCGNNFSVIAQVAHDHLIPQTFSLMQGNSDRTDVLLQHGEWWWVVKTQFTF